LNQEFGDRFEHMTLDGPSTSDPEELLDEWIARCKSALGTDSYDALHMYGCDYVLTWIRRDLSDFGVAYDHWYSERSLARTGCIQRALEVLREARCIYQKDGAQWFRAGDFGDEKDRVVVRDNGSATYFASDIAYHADKYERGFDLLIDVWGADHHGYAPRIKAAMSALGKDPDSLEVLLVQFASLFRAGEKVQMSTRAGEFVTLGQLVEDVGRDAARFFYVTRRPDQHLDFDLDLAKSQSSENPVYYIQYAHARICSVFRQLEHKGLGFDGDGAVRVLDRLTEDEERTLTSLLSRYPDVIEEAAAQREPHQLVNYLRELANEFHVYYNTHKMIVDDADLRGARLALASAVRTVIGNGLALLGVSAPVEM
jgi:arginyl-tRNA synthetase